ncbi:MAG: asparaginase domain-containing protein [bacterium]
MTLRRKNVLLLFGGGTALIHHDGMIREVRSQTDAASWLKQIPELNILAQLRPVFCYTGAPFNEQPAWWQTIASTIAKRYKEFDGFIITQPIDAIPYTAAALTLMLPRIGKPVVITGSPDLPQGKISKKTLKEWRENAALGVRANLVNAAQVATLDVGEVTVLFGNRLLRGGNVVRHTEPSLNVFESAGVAPLGRVDFGFKLEPHCRARSAALPRLATALKTRILQIPLVPTTATTTLPAMTEGTLDGVFVSGDPHAAPPSALDAICAEAKKHGLPVAVYSHWPGKQTDRYLAITGVTPAMGLVKFMWSLGQTANEKNLQKLLAADYAGEVIRREKRLP